MFPYYTFNVLFQAAICNLVNPLNLYFLAISITNRVRSSKLEASSKPTGQRQPQASTSNVDMNSIATLIENTVRKVMDEKLNQLLAAHQTSTINENLVLKVGDSIFKGKITGVNKAK